ncbi:helix-turn-helix transcriptional regulator [Streptomyces sp. SID3212]|uniref:helix-turn-helix domain-containing protein n=1 Tax=Streptomyces sp. SID3212 TaxID=2690259 RepID=UPI00136850F3|nr:helix-turn-helix transcriptional regulator [Streptomyces sp. SID3212]MYV56485.1 helix-turn-helix domain-containing protein [Streptomyces sp. SID3212]
MRAHYQDPAQIRRRRIEAGLTQEALGARAGYSKGHVSGVERGIAGASAQALARLAEALGCEVSDLMAAPEHAPASA